MASRNNDSVDDTADTSRDSATDKSFMGKFVSGILNSTPLSKWFGSGDTPAPVRRREDDDDEDDGPCSFQPPLKRAKLLSRGGEDQRGDNSFPQYYGSPLTSSVNQNSSNTNVHNNMVPPSYNHFPEPVAGPSGINSRRSFTPRAVTNVSAQSHPDRDLDSESDDSTDGYLTAPRLSKTRRQDDTPDTSISAVDSGLNTKSLFRSSFDVTTTRSLFSDRSLSPKTNSAANTSLSSRRPAFNSSTFGTPSFVDRTLTTQRILTSPFYTGQTTYGGAAAHGRRISATRASPSNVKSVQIKPVNEKTSSSSGSNSSLSLTARRILNTLEQYSTPISDAKKIPVQTPKERQEGILSRYVGANPYLVRDRSKKAGPSTRELQVPSIPELLRQKQRLQNTTVNVRQIATQSKSSLNDQSYSLRPMEENPRQQSKRSNKMKSSVTSSIRHQRGAAEETAPISAVNLPEASLPKMMLPPVIPPLLLIEQPKKTDKPAAKESNNNNNNSTTGSDAPSNSNCCYKFSSPLVLRDNSQGKTIPSINCFKFSEPKTVDSKFRLNGENARSDASSSDVPAKGFGSQFKLSGDKWECDVCMVRNNNTDSSCVACTSPRPNSNNGPKDTFKSSPSKLPPILGATGLPLSRVGFGDAFKPPSSTWECTVCMIRNKDNLVKCAACETPKSSGGASKTMTGAAAAPVQSFIGFGDKFKAPSDTWECSACMVRNKNELQKCVACETQRQQQQQERPQSATTFTTSQMPTSTTTMMDKFKPASDTWECPTCMIRNKNELNRCAACESTRPGASTQQPQNAFSFGVPKPADGSWECTTCLVKNKSTAGKCVACEVPKNGFGDRFKSDGNKWECSSCMVKNQQDSKECVCCGVPKPGSASLDTSKLASNKSVLTFNFGVDTSGPKFQFGIPPGTTATTTTPPPPKKDESPAPPASGFVFGSPAKVTAAAPAAKVESPPKAETPKAPNPLLRPEEKLPEKVAAVPPSGFTFGVPSSPTVTISAVSTVANTAPTFSFKPTTTAVNGDVSKIVFGAKPEMADAKDAAPSKTATPATQFKFETKTPPAAPQQPAALFKFGVSPSNKRPNSDDVPNQIMKQPTPSNGFTIGEMPGFSKARNSGTGFKFNATPETAAATFKFGSSDNNQTSKITTAPAAADATTPFKFGGSLTGSAGAAPAPTIGGFNFAAPANPSFSFGKTDVTDGGGFNSPATASSASASNNASAAKNGSFNFGPPVTNNNNQKAVFSFGASQTGQQQPAAAAVQPSFGQAATAAAPAIAGGFNFAAAPTLGAPAGFNFSGAPPSFNYSDGSSSSGGPQRRFKRALRRTTPR